MICALRSSFFRFVRTGLWLKGLIASVITAGILMFNNGMVELGLLPFQQPRYINNTFIITNLMYLVFVIPFGAAIFTLMHTGNDVAFRAINNKIATGISRTHIFLSDLIVSLLATELSVLIHLLCFYLYAKFAPVKENVHLNKQIFNLLLCILVISAAFCAVFLLLQFFCSNKLLALILSVLIIPALALSSELVNDKLSEPYRYRYYDEATQTEHWEANPRYVSGFPREVLTFAYNVNPYTFMFLNMENDTLTTQAEAAGAVVLLSTAAGLVSINKKEYP